MVAADWRLSYDTLADGADVTSAVGITNGSTSRPKARTSAAIKGPVGVLFDALAGTDQWLAKTITASGTVVEQSYFKISAGTVINTAVPECLQIRNTAGSRALSARLTTAKVLQVADAGGAVLMTSGSALANGDYVITIAATKGTTTTNGRVGAWLRNVTGDTLVVAAVDVSTANTGTTDFNQLRKGKTSGTGDLTLAMDEWAYTLGTFAEIDRVTASVVMNAGPDQLGTEGNGVEDDTVVTLDSSASTGVASGRTWSQTSGTSVTLNSTSATSPTFTTPKTLTGATLVFRVTDNATSAFDSVTVTVQPSARRVKIGGVMTPVSRRVKIP